MTETMLYFGSFNPIHKGHLAIAEYLLAERFCDELWLVVSPHNPLKDGAKLVDEQNRLAMARIAVESSAFKSKIVVSDAEFSLPKPSYTIDTLSVFEERFAERKFAVLIGSDNVDNLDQWKEYELLTTKYKFYVYPRKGAEPTKFGDRITVLHDAPLCDYSSTQVREMIGRGEDCGAMLDRKVADYITDRKIWTKERLHKAK